MARPRKYRRNVYLFKLPSNAPIHRSEDRIVMSTNEFCKVCRKPLNYKQKRFGYAYCSYKCANKAKAEKLKGRKRRERNNVIYM